MQKLYEDKIPNLQHTAGTISMPAGARLTIGGQQYITLTSVSVAANLSLANTRYQIYAVVVGGAIQLVVSQNENSQGPAGHNAWKLVGSYYTSITSAFLQFASIKKVPYNNITEIMDLTGVGDFTGGTISVTRSNGNIVMQVATTLTYNLDTTPSTGGINYLPLWARPDVVSFNTAGNGSSDMTFFQVTNAGGILFTTRDYAGAGVAKTSIAPGPTSSYSAQIIDITPIEDL